LEEAILSLKGVNGQLELYNNKVVIKRKGFHAKIMKGLFSRDKELYFNQICGVQFKAANNTNGYIKIIVHGTKENNVNLISFNKNSNEIAIKINTRIKGLRQEVSNLQTVNKLIVSDEIKKYKELLDDGIITQAEYDVKKKQLLNLDEIKRYKELLDQDIITQEEYDKKKKTII
jgi:hypothetical protein